MAISLEEIEKATEPEAKELLRLVVIGSVDDGKSTLLGRLLYESGGLFEDQVEHVRRASRNGDPIDFSLFTDGLKAEREQGITIDVAYRYFETARRKFILADTPGHAQYTRNMATGASTADAAIILVDARLGLLPQTRRHAAIASLLGIRRLAVAVNKMDLVGFDPRTFERIAGQVRSFVEPLGFAHLALLPVSARFGDNVAEPSPRTPWHRGGTVLGFLESVKVERDRAGQPLRFPVQNVLRPHLDYRGLAGQIASGALAVGDEVVVLPSGARSRVRAIETFDGALPRAHAPMSVVVRLADEVDAGRGDLLAHPASAPMVVRRLEATAVWLAERPLDLARPYLIKIATRTSPARVEAVRWRFDPESGSQTSAPSLALNDIGRMVVRAARPIAADPYAVNRATGAFILIDSLTNETVAAGMIAATAEAPELTGGERRPHAGTVLLIRAETEAMSLARAHELERVAAESGLTAVVARRLTAARAGAAAGLLVLFPVPGGDGHSAREVLRAEGIEPIDFEGEVGPGALRRALAREDR
jgi:sulfate adenylyltransferase subunit 1